ncbi:hypothetical protein NCC49_004362 [Naganishia albida]|nr:hypothetical protein NCC49_004362 [Naganishia albida]
MVSISNRSLRNLGKFSIRTFSNAAATRPIHRLTSDSPYIRSFGHPDASDSTAAGDDFLYFPDFFNEAEQEVLLKLALWKLDRVDASRRRRRRRSSVRSEGGESGTEENKGLQRSFEDTSAYGFEDGHFDSVITKYRESLLTAFPNPSTIDAPTYPSILKRIYDLLPQSAGSELARDLYYDKVLPDRTQIEQSVSDQPFEQPLQTSTHALHLAPEGYILPHVDNVDASGTVIIGVSLGAERILRLEEASQEGRKTNIVHKGWDVLLKTGSLYLQRDTIRYNYVHSILPYGPDSTWAGSPLVPGHRVSLMIRDAKQEEAKSLSVGI